MILRSAIALLGAHLKRLLRENMARRALGFPVVLTTLTLLATLAVVSIGRGRPIVSVHPDTPASLQAAVESSGLQTLTDANPHERVQERGAVLGIHGTQLWSVGGRDALIAEAHARRTLGSTWTPKPPPLPGPDQSQQQGMTIATLLLAIYALYGVVFGAGMIARDRDDATLEVELTLALPRWIHGATRWLAATLVVGLWIGLAVAFTAVLMGLPDPWATARHGLGAAAAAVALGLASVGRAGLRSGFAASLAAGLSVTTGLLGLGYALPAVGAWLPLGSLAAQSGTGWPPLLGSLVIAALSIGVFTWRSARA
ncbi:MAG: ABC transporter permease subunit [Myxococcota bacterium]